MKKLLMAFFCLLAPASLASASDIAGVAWTQNNLAILRSFTKADVAKFINSGLVKTVGSFDGTNKTKTLDIQEFTWADLTGTHRYQLVVVLKSFNSYASNTMGIYHRDAAGKLGEWWFQGMDIQLKGWPPPSYIPKAIQDLKGDGKEEIIIPIEFGRSSGSAARSTWPRVYKQVNWRFVDASREVPSFYDKQVLPEYAREIAGAREQVAHAGDREDSAEAEGRLVGLIMARDKVLRVIGRDPKAGEKQAHEWISGPDAHPLEAIMVYRDLGDHDADIRAAMNEIRHEDDAALKQLAAKKAKVSKEEARKRAAAEKKLGITDKDVSQ
ncbi:MAG TPA: hypothetical protein VMB26_12100 [Candidatus Binataceae bacterium]|nr:hypothetical protein [Candidatus Binataceae bacterium]